MMLGGAVGTGAPEPRGSARRRRAGRGRELAGALLALAAAACATSPGTGAAPGPMAGASATAPAAGAATPASMPERDYLLFVASEATDEVQLVRFGPRGARVERRHEVGFHPADPDGPHGLDVSPDGRFYYVTTAHGVPNGYLWKFRTEDSALLGRTELGLFPASLQVSPDGLYAYVVNFNLHGEMVPSSVSIVSTAEMVEVARLTTCAMPHGSRLSPDGARHYSACMMDDVLIEIDAPGFRVARHFMLTPGREHGMAGAPGGEGGMPGAAAHAMERPADSAPCSPTWAAPSADGRRVYVACNGANDVAEIDVEAWRLVRRIPAGEGVYNLAATRDGRMLIATNRRGRSVSFFDSEDGRELARVATLRPVLHGIALSDDGRYAFISVEGIGSEPGTVEMIDLSTFERVQSVDVGQMSGGIDFWKSEPEGP
jgi:DNA-binding beta-propeller fold protein YncE